MTEATLASPALCVTCGKVRRAITVRGEPTGQYVCLACSPSDGTCPRCASRLRTPRAEQCRHCRADWHDHTHTPAAAPASNSAPATPSAVTPPSAAASAGLPFGFVAVAAGAFFLYSHREQLAGKGGFIVLGGAIILGIMSANIFAGNNKH